MKTLTLLPRSPYSFAETLWFLDRNLDDCMHAVSGDKVLKALYTSKGPALISVSSSQDAVTIKLLEGPRGVEDELSVFVNEWFDLDRDLRPFYKLLKNDKDFAILGKKYRGFKIVGIPDLFECLVWCIAGQQINLTFAYALKRRLVEKWGEKITHKGKHYYLFPFPETLASIPVEEFRRMQFTTRKAEYIRGISAAFADEKLNKKILLAKRSEEEMLTYLLSFRGIGQWSANYALMKSLGAMNRIPFGDAGINQALLKHKAIPRGGDEAVKKVFLPFEGWKTYLVFYLWRSLREMA
jgi:DNA-3-methyladenine glycosylase II